MLRPLLAAALAALSPACLAPDASPQPECDPSAPLPEQKAECDDGDPHTLDRCAPTGDCSHEPAECDPLDSLTVKVAACGDEPCVDWRCRGDATCVSAVLSGCVP